MLGVRSFGTARDLLMTAGPGSDRMLAHANLLSWETRQMHMATRTRRWTRVDLERMPDDGNRYEVVRGELFVTPAPSPRHQHVVHELAERLRRFVEAMGLGEVHQSPSAVVFEASEVQPDIIVRRTVR